jgi:hypothetical protein
LINIYRKLKIVARLKGDVLSLLALHLHDHPLKRALLQTR